MKTLRNRRTVIVRLTVLCIMALFITTTTVSSANDDYGRQTNTVKIVNTVNTVNTSVMASPDVTGVEVKTESTNETANDDTDIIYERNTEIVEEADIKEYMEAVNFSGIYMDSDSFGKKIVFSDNQTVTTEDDIFLLSEDNDENNDSSDLTSIYNENMVKKLSDEEFEIMCRIVEAEATGEKIIGKILVANVVLNRVNDKCFPDSVEEVVFQKIGGSYQFSPTKDGRYWTVEITEDTIEAVKRALEGEDYSKGSLYFFERARTTKKKAAWFDSLDFQLRYGCHEFFK